MNLPVYERRYFISLLKNENVGKQERAEEAQEQAKLNAQSGGKGKRTTRVSGDALKSRMASGSVI